MSALRRNFFSHVAQELRTVEHTLTYIESAIRGYLLYVFACSFNS